VNQDDPGDENDASHRIVWARSTINVLHFQMPFVCWQCSEQSKIEVCIEWDTVPCPYCGSANEVRLPHERDVPKGPA
jgi:hypothetical protein